MSARVTFSGSGRPLISVVMPVYDAERYVAEAIQSILAQTYPHLEFIIVDDGSADGSAGIVREFAARDTRIQPLFLPHQGQAFALNAGVALARGEFIAHLDNDDIALPERFAIQLDWMRQTGVDVCGGLLKRFGDQEGVLWFPETHKSICHELLFRIGLHHGTSLVRAEIAKAHAFNVEALHVDYEMLTRLATRYRLGNVPQVLLKHRCHPRQAHVVYNSEFRADINKFRQPYFRALFPDATPEDYAALARVAEKQAFSDLAELERAGRWLVRLAQTPDNFLPQRMTERWHATCRRSAFLGLGCYRLHQQLASQFGVPKQSTLKLCLACALRLRSDSSLCVARAWVKQRMKHPQPTEHSNPDRTALPASDH